MKRLLLVLAGCSDALDQRLDVIDQPRVLAVISEPPEVVPGTPVMMSALIADPSGVRMDPIAWSLCTAPKPPTEDNAVATGCVENQVTATDEMPVIPMNACQTYGPDVAQTGFRPRDPDGTGGYYQPVRADITGLDLAFGFARITCDLPTAPGDVAHDYQLSYVANANPVLTATIDGDTITASWDPPEQYLYYDPDSETLITRRESMRVSWFTTSGSFDVDATAVDETDLTTSVTQTLRGATAATIFVVLRDSRGGIATATLQR
ncbi:MAG: hypothetical protein QM831_07015 [Kofleriaceae bacterium]